MNKTVSIHLEEQGISFSADAGLKLLEALMRHGIFLRADCGGSGVCGKCRVIILNGDNGPEAVNACGYILTRDIHVKIPPSSIPSSFIMSKAPLSFPDSFNMNDDPSPGNGPCGIAVDLGTTTIAVYLCDTGNKEVLSTIAMKNPQSLYGADVMSRITAVAENDGTLSTLQQLTAKGIEWGVRKLLDSSDRKPLTVEKMVVVGNPAMIHIFTGTDPKTIGMSPYQPAFYEARSFESRDLSFTMDPFTIYTLPNVSGFLGGDILAAAQAADMENQPDGTLLIDLGTNGELLLKQKNFLHATSCATGPAFEGATLSCGIQAIPGAINSVEINDENIVTAVSMVQLSEKETSKPTGICGAGVISTVAQFCRKQIIRPDGAFTSGDDRFILVPEDSENQQPSIYISQKDIRSVQLGKSALITGISFLMKKAGIDTLEKLIIAGAFGTYLDTVDMKRLGMIPDMDNDRIFSEGNLAGSGAVMALCDGQYIKQASRMAEEIETVELALDPEFQDAFVDNLGFPE